MERVQVERFYLGCLAHASYMIGSEGVAAIIDPQRDVDIYIEAAARNGWKIEHIIETHLHADFVSGHRELAQRTGAKIYLGTGSGAQFPHVEVKDEDEVRFGQCCLRFLQTPGHTIESICIVMNDTSEPERPADVFTGDTLFVGDVGRPDLSATHTPQQLAALLFHSLHKKLLTLPDETRLFPAHGAGSLCGRQMSSESFSTIGQQKRTNYALQAKTSDEFVRLVTENLAAAPEYFSQEVVLNRMGAAPLSELPAMPALPALAVMQSQSEGAIIVDTRVSTEFAAAHVPGSINISLTGQYASWAAQILGLDSTVIIVAEDPEHAAESQIRLARVGLEKVIGYLDKETTGWVKAGYELESTPQVTVQDLAALCNDSPGEVALLDVREAAEREGGLIEGSQWIPLGKLKARTAELNHNLPVIVYCRSGYRSSIATSILQAAGFKNVVNMIGGFDAWKAAGLPCAVPTTAGA
jgi:glyoxylase-like metal-dependent hydrolase (beta-lactamase superfamily II)/rhodanese-related sulfurtransferase